MLAVVAASFDVSAGVGSDAAVALHEFSEVVGGDSATVVYIAREFVTMDPERPSAEAIAVRDGRFVAVGSRAEVEDAAGEGALIDESFAGRVAFPGFIDPRVHPVLAALTMSSKVISIEAWDALEGYSPAVRDAEGYRERLLRALADHRGKLEPFVTWGYHQAFHGRMSRGILDSLMPRFPVIVWHRSCAEFYLNSAALELTGIDAAFIDGLTPVQRSGSDYEQGHFADHGAVAILGRLKPLLAPPGRLERGLEYTETYYHRNGITLACGPGSLVSKPLQEAVNAVYSDTATPFNHCFTADGRTFATRLPDSPEAVAAGTRQVLSWGEGRTWYLPKQVKLGTDGGIFQLQMQLKNDDGDVGEGAWVMEPDAFDRAFQTYWSAGYQIHVESSGDAGLDLLLASLRRAIVREPRADHRTTLVRFGFAEPEQVVRLADLGGIVSANPYYLTALASRHAALGVDPERARNMVPMKEVMELGVDFAFHSDMPVAPARPLLLVWAAVNRVTDDGQIMGPEHRVPREAALRAVTMGAAYSIRQEDEVGSIEVGKQANLTILDANPLDMPVVWIKDIPVWGTMLEGRLQPLPKTAAPEAAGLSSARESGR